MSQKQYVLIFSTAYLPLLGGAELAIKEVTDRIRDLHFILITARMRRDLPRRERIGNVDVYRVGVGIPLLDKLLSPFLAAFHVLWITRRPPAGGSVGLFWSVMVSYTTITPVLLKMFGLYKNTPLLLTLQEGDSEKHIFKGRFGLIAYWWHACFRYADHMQVISTYLERLARDFGYRGSLSVVPNGVDTNVFYPRDITKEKNLIVTTSRLVRKNGIDLLIQAMPFILERVSDAKLHIIGDGADRSKLEDIVRSAHLEKAVTFFGSVPFEKIPNYLAPACVFVRPSRSEGLGTAFLEAMAMGIPVVATRVGGIPDFLKDEKTGLFADVESAEDVARQVIRLLTDDALHSALSKNGKELVRDSYAWDMVAHKMRDIMIRL